MVLFYLSVSSIDTIYHLLLQYLQTVLQEDFHMPVFNKRKMIRTSLSRRDFSTVLDLPENITISITNPEHAV